MSFCATLEMGSSREGQGVGLFSTSLVSFLVFLYRQPLQKLINVFGIWFVSLRYLKILNNCHYLLCSFYFLKIKIHTKVLFHRDWTRRLPSRPGRQYSPGSVSVKSKEEKQTKDGFSDLSAKCISGGFCRTLFFVEMHHRLRRCFASVECKQLQWFCQRNWRVGGWGWDSSYLAVLNMKFPLWKAVCLHQEELWCTLCSCS